MIKSSRTRRHHARLTRVGGICACLLGSMLLVAAAVTSSGAQTTDATVEPGALPAFTAAFTPAAVTPGAVSTLTFTINNAASVGATTALAFTGSLPPGLTIAAPSTASIASTASTTTPPASTTCGAGSVTVDPTTGTITLSGGSVAASASCTVSANVTAPAAGTFTAGSSVLSSSAGDVGGVNASVVVAAAAATTTVPVQAAAADKIVFTKSFEPTSVVAGGTAKLIFKFDNTATGATEATGVGFTDTFPTTPGAMVATATTPTQLCGAAQMVGTVTVAADKASVKLEAATVPANTTCLISVEVTVPATPTEGSYANTAKMTPDPTPATNGTAIATLTVSATAATTTTLPITTVSTLPLATTEVPAATLATTGLSTVPLTVAGLTFLLLGTIAVVASDRRRALRR